MHSDTVKLNTQILSDPVAAYADIPGKSQTVIKQIEQQHAVISKLKTTLKELQLKSKILSRQIGEARKSNGDIEPLKSEMKQLSDEQKTLINKIKQAETRILQHFDTSTDKHSRKQQDSTVMSINEPAALRPNIDTALTENITVTVLENEQALWNEYVEKHPLACIHHRSEWKRIMEDSYGHHCAYYMAHDENRNIVGILPLVQLKSRFFGNLMVSMPYFQHAGALADHPSIEHKLMSAANQQAKSEGIEHIEYRDIYQREMPAQSHKVNMVLPLPEDEDTLWKSFNAKLRSQIKRSQREDTTTTIGHAELLDDFYCVYARNMRDLGSPPHSKTFIRNILTTYPSHSWLIIVKLAKKPVAAGFLLASKDSMEIPLASTIRDVNPLSINMLLYWNILKFAIDRGYKKFNFGRSTKDAGTYRFKKQWGAIPVPLYWHYWLNDGGQLPSLNPSNPKFALVIYLWKKLPIVISTLLGPVIVKNIP